MAITYDGLIEQIEKTAVKCGFEDFKFTEGQNWTISLLKDELAKWKSILKQKTDEKRAVKNIINAAKDFFVKSDKVFKGDMYIIDCVYVLPGPIAKKSLVGDVFLQIDDSYVDPIQKVILNGETYGVWYIEDVSLMKQGMTAAIDNGVEYESCAEKVEDDSVVRNELATMLDETYNDMDDFITIPKQQDPKIFTRKKVFRLESGSARPVLLNIQLLPTVVTEKDLENVEYCLKLDNTAGGKIPVYYVRIRISFSHYNINLRYEYT